MSTVRHANALTSSASATGFWGGMTVGRLGLSFLTSRLGEFYSVLLYLFLAVLLELIFWLVPSLITSAITVALLGAVMGPMFPTAIVLVTGFPFLVGAIAQRKGVRTLQPIILALLVVIAGLWICMPRRGKNRVESENEESAAGQESSVVV
jgi:hypothetical protein